MSVHFEVILDQTRKRKKKKQKKKASYIILTYPQDYEQ